MLTPKIRCCETLLNGLGHLRTGELSIEVHRRAVRHSRAVAHGNLRFHCEQQRNERRRKVPVHGGIDELLRKRRHLQHIGSPPKGGKAQLGCSPIS